jgi:hypothetical protein
VRLVRGGQWAGHGLPKISPEPTMPYPSTPCGRATGVFHPFRHPTPYAYGVNRGDPRHMRMRNPLLHMNMKRNRNRIQKKTISQIRKRKNRCCAIGTRNDLKCEALRSRTRSVWQGVSMDSLMFYPGPPCTTVLSPAGGPPPKCSGGGPPGGRSACGRLLSPWIPHAVRA